MKNKRLLSAIIVLQMIVIVGFLATRNDQISTVILLRHAEKSEIPKGDVSLNEQGKLRAESLIDVVGSAGITVIYSTQFARTRQTVEPLSVKLDLNVQIIEVEHSGIELYIKSISDKIRSEHAGETVLVVSHSNTVPMIIEELGGGTIAPIADDDYGDLFILSSRDWDEKVNLLKVKY